MNEEEFSDLKEMFNSKGWALFSEDARQEYEQIKESLLHVEDNNKFHFYRGRLFALRSILTLKETLELQQEQNEKDTYRL